MSSIFIVEAGFLVHSSRLGMGIEDAQKPPRTDFFERR
jgi:hypothetical protein